MNHLETDTLAAFALDALDARETETVAAHLASCTQCRDDLAQWRESAAALALLAPRVVPPPELRARVLSKAVAAGQPSRPALVASAPVRRPRLLQFAAAASLIAAVGLGAALARANAGRAQLEERLAAITALADERAETLAQRDSLLARVLGPETRIASLAATGAAPSVRLFWDASRSELIISARQLPPAAVGSTYQLWGIGANGTPVGLGTFNSAPDGRAVVVLAVNDASSFTVSAVTVEPDGGSPAPTSTPILVGNWSADPIQSRD